MYTIKECFFLRQVKIYFGIICIRYFRKCKLIQVVHLKYLVIFLCVKKLKCTNIIFIILIIFQNVVYSLVVTTISILII